MKYFQAMKEAEIMIDRLSPICKEIRIAGSLRRGDPLREYDEIDLLAIPKTELDPPPFPRAVFGAPIPKVYKTWIDRYLADLVEMEKIRITESGPRSKKFLSLTSEISFDLYLVLPPSTWGVQYVIRTGPRDFSHWIVTRRGRSAHSNLHGRVRGGALPDGYRVQGGAVWEGEEKVPDKELLDLSPIGFDTEEAFFDWLGLGWIDPRERVARWGSKG